MRLLFTVVSALGAFACAAPVACAAAVSGSAYGSFLHVSIFGGPFNDQGPTPAVTLAPAGSAVPVTATAPTGSAKVGPATFFTSGPITVSTQGTTGASGSVTSSATIDTLNTSGQESFTASNVASTCTASAAGASGSTTIRNGTLQIDNGDTTAGDVHSPVDVPLPTNPAPNTSFVGHIHVNGSQDNFRYVFNEQIVNPDGSITVNAAHEFLIGPTAVGDLIIGQSVCGITATGPPSSPTVSTTASGSGPVGATISDSAALAGGVNPTGTIMFTVFGPRNPTCTGTAAFTSTVTVAGNGTYNSGTFTPTAPGTYRFVASYSGDANNSPAGPTSCNDPAEAVVVSPANPTITTRASASVPVGGTISDTAVLAGGVAPTGTITFTVFGPGNPTCTGTPAFTSTSTVSGNGPYSSASFTTTAAGTYQFVAGYSGDNNNSPVTSGCGSANESVVVTQASPTIVTTASSTVPAGGAISDSATLTGGSVPTGTITFTLFGPGNATCVGTPIFTSTKPVNGDGVYPSDPFTAAQAGTYNWVTLYGGDSNNASATSACGAASESVTVTLAVPRLVTRASAPVALGNPITDTATLSGGAVPTGTITFSVFGPNNANCTGTPAFTSTVTVAAGNGNYSSGPLTPTAPGTYRFVARYSGDANNSGAGPTSCGDPAEAVVVSPVNPTITTRASASAGAGAGAALSDTATLQGGVNPTGTITFQVFGPNNAACSGTPAFTSTKPVTGNGTYTSDSFTAPAPGTYRFVATYSGDANNSPPGSTSCTDPAESVTVAGPAIAVTKVASPTSRIEPGGSFTFTVTVSNPSAVDPIRVTNLVDNIYGDLATRAGSTCGALIGVTLAPGGVSSPCTFTGSFTGVAGASQTDTVTATGVDSNAFTATATAQATVTLTPAPPQIAVTKVASPLSMAQPGGTFTFTVTVSNPSTLEPVKITSLVDNVYGNIATRPGSTCGGLIGVVLAPGATSAPCTFTGPFTGVAGASQTDVVTVTGSNLGTTVTATANATVTLTKAPLPISTQVSPATAGFGSPFQDVATLGPVASGGPPPTGSVTFNVYGPNNATCTGTPAFTSTNPLTGTGTSVPSGSFTPPALGTYRVVATYSGDPNYLTSTTACGDSRESVVIDRAATTTTLTATPPSPSTFGQTVTYTATVAPVPPASGTPTGTVTFVVDGTTVGTRPVSPSGTASITTASLPLGSHTITATYSGDAIFLPSTGTLSYSVACDVTITGVHEGALEVRSSVCIAPGAEVTGSIIVHDGGSLDLEGAQVDGAILANGVSGSIRICDSQVNGAVDIKNSTGPVIVGDPAAGCGPNQIGGALLLKDNTGGVAANGNTAPVTIDKGNSGPDPLPAALNAATAGLATPGAASATTGSNGGSAVTPGVTQKTLASGCGTEHLGSGGPLSKLPLFSVLVSGGSTSCATARAVLTQFTHHVVKHAKVLGFSCTRISSGGLARCVKGAITITDKLVRRL